MRDFRTLAQQLQWLAGEIVAGRLPNRLPFAKSQLVLDAICPLESLITRLQRRQVVSTEALTELYPEVIERFSAAL